MPRSSKAGPARSRRRPDPGTVIKQAELLAPLRESSATPGAGSLSLELLLINPASPNQTIANVFYETGLATKIVLIDVNGDRHTPVITGNYALGSFTLDWASGLPAGFASVTVNAREPAIRGKKGEWLGTFSGTYTIT